MSILETAKKLLETIGIIRALLASFSIGIAHNIGFLSQPPKNLATILDAAFLANLSIQFTIFISATLVFAVLFSHLSALIYGFTLSHYTSSLERRRNERLFPLKKRERYFDLVRRRSDRKFKPILFIVRWLLPSAIAGYYYTGAPALFFLPSLIVLLIMTAPVLYPKINVDSPLMDGEGGKGFDAELWIFTHSNISSIRQMTTFAVSALIILSFYIGFARHNYLVRSAEFVLEQDQRNVHISIVGSTSKAILAFNKEERQYQLISLGSFAIITPAAH